VIKNVRLTFILLNSFTGRKIVRVTDGLDGGSDDEGDLGGNDADNNDDKDDDDGAGGEGGRGDDNNDNGNDRGKYGGEQGKDNEGDIDLPTSLVLLIICLHREANPLWWWALQGT
jgi:hypothetical protein